MQNNDNTKRSKGFYILAALCVLIIGVSGFFFLRDADEEQQPEQTLSIPPRAQVDEQSPTQEEQDAPAEQTMTHDEQLPQTVMPVSGSVLQGYSAEVLTYNQTTRDWRTHGGVDLAASVGEQVKAARSGTVMAVYEDESLGTTVMLQHDGGYTTTYSGLAAEPAVAAGQSVTAGQTIGTVGDTALIETAMESHLHFEVCKDGETVDPAGFLY